MTKRQTIKAARRVYVYVGGTEFYIKTTKTEIGELAKHLGGWDRIGISMNDEIAYVDVEFDNPYG